MAEKKQDCDSSAESRLIVDADPWRMMQRAYFNPGLAMAQLDLLDRHCHLKGWKWQLDVDQRSGEYGYRVTRQELANMKFAMINKFRAVESFVAIVSQDPTREISAVFPFHLWRTDIEVQTIEDDNLWAIYLRCPELTADDLKKKGHSPPKFTFADLATLRQEGFEIVRVETAFIHVEASDRFNELFPQPLLAGVLPVGDDVYMIDAKQVPEFAADFRADFPAKFEPTHSTCIVKFMKILSSRLKGKPLVGNEISRGDLSFSTLIGAGADQRLVKLFPMAEIQDDKVVFRNVPAIYREMRRVALGL